MRFLCYVTHDADVSLGTRALVKERRSSVASKTPWQRAIVADGLYPTRVPCAEDPGADASRGLWAEPCCASRASQRRKAGKLSSAHKQAQPPHMTTGPSSGEGQDGAEPRSTHAPFHSCCAAWGGNRAGPQRSPVSLLRQAGGLREAFASVKPLN